MARAKEDFSSEALSAVLSYFDRGWAPIPIEPQGKRPVDRDVPWTTPLDRSEVERWWGSANYNVGVLLGDPSRWLVDIDLDCAEARAMASSFLPPTDAKFGRRSTPASHWLYKVSDPAATTVFQDPDKSADPDGKKAVLVELRATGAQTIFPPSIHKETGEEIRWERGANGEPATVHPDALRQAVGKLVAACVISHHWVSGARHNLTLALCGTFVRLGWDEDKVKHFIETICRYTNDEESRTADIHTTFKKAGKDKKFTGYTTLTELIGEKASAIFKRALFPDEGDDIVDELNKEFAMVMLENKVRILHETEGGEFRALDAPSFKLWIAQRPPVIIPDPEGKPKVIPAADYWIKSKRQRRYPGGIVFKPGGEAEGEYNMWRGFAVEPDERGDCSLFMEHCALNLCDGNEEHYQWLLDWMAEIVQNTDPEKKPAVALVLRGQQGTGKSVFAETFGHLFGRHYVAVSDPRHFMGNFNAHLKDRVLLHAEEAFFAGDKGQTGKLRAMISGPKLQIELKGIDTMEVDNHLRLIVTSNEHWVVPAAMDERRFGIIETSNRRKQDSTFFGAMIAQMKNGGYGKLLHMLQTREYSLARIKNLPKTALLLDQKIRSASPVDQWLMDRLMEGDLAPDAPAWAKIGGKDGWPEDVAKQVVYESFIEHADAAGARKVFESVFWSEIRGALPGLEDVRHIVPGQERQGAFRGKVRKVFVHLPSLEACRVHFEQRMGAPIAWPGVGKEIEENDF